MYICCCAIVASTWGTAKAAWKRTDLTTSEMGRDLLLIAECHVCLGADEHSPRADQRA